MFSERRIVMVSRVSLRVLVFYVMLSVGRVPFVYEQNVTAAGRKQKTSDTRLSQLVEANIIATHAYQVLLSKKSGKGDPTCFGPGRLSNRELESLVEHQSKLLKSNMPAVNDWVRGGKSDFD